MQAMFEDLPNEIHANQARPHMSSLCILSKRWASYLVGTPTTGTPHLSARSLTFATNTFQLGPTMSHLPIFASEDDEVR